MPKIRPISQKDNHAVANIIRTVLEEYRLDLPGTAYFDPQLDYMYDYYQTLENSEYWVIEEEGRIVGGVGVGLLAESVAGFGKMGEVQKLYLLPEARGKGYAKKLMARLQAFAVSRGYDYLYLETIHTLEAAIKLYEKLAFERLNSPIDAYGHHSTMDVFMGKRLNNSLK